MKAKYAVITGIEYENGRSEEIVNVLTPDPECDVVGLVVDGEVVIAWTPEEFTQFVQMCIRAGFKSFELLAGL